MSQSIVTSDLGHPLVEPDAVFIAVPNHDWNKEGMTGNCWRGPYPTKERAQQEAAKWMVQHGWPAVGVFKLVGTITKPIPNLAWHEVVESAPAQSTE